MNFQLSGYQSVTNIRQFSENRHPPTFIFRTRDYNLSAPAKSRVLWAAEPANGFRSIFELRPSGAVIGFRSFPHSKAGALRLQRKKNLRNSERPEREAVKAGSYCTRSARISEDSRESDLRLVLVAPFDTKRCRRFKKPVLRAAEPLTVPAA